MKAPIIINDSPHADKAGDLCIYESEAKAKAALDHESANDDYLHVFDRSGYFYEIVVDPQNGEVFFKKIENVRYTDKQIRNLLVEHIQNVSLKTFDDTKLVDTDVDQLIKLAFEFDPNPYSGS